MVEALINTRIGVPLPTDSSARLSEPARSHTAEPRPEVTALTSNVAQAPQALQAAVLALPVLAPDVLIAAQQARDTTPPESYDERPSLTSGFSQQGDENSSNSADEANASSTSDQGTSVGTGAEVIPLFGPAVANDVFSTQFASAAQTATAQSAPPVLAPEPSSAPSSAPSSDRAAAFAQANQAYVDAGAADGRTFGAAVFETVTLSTTQSPVNLLA